MGLRIKAMNNMEQAKDKSLKNRILLIGSLFLLAFVFYGGGNALVSNGHQAFGLMLMLINSAVVISIGVLLRAMMSLDAQFSSDVYLVTRLAEALLLGTGAIIWTLDSENFNAAELNTTLYRLGMIILGLGSIGFCRWLLVTRTVHVGLAWLGLVGYPLLALAMIVEFAGSEYWASIFLIPGAVFELIFGLSLLFAGIRIPFDIARNNSIN